MGKTMRILCAGLLAWTMVGVTQAGWAVTLMPLTLVMAQGKAVVSLHVRNDDANPRIYEIQVYRWSQQDGRDVLAPATDLIVTPPIMKLGAGEEKTVRIGMLEPDSSRKEEAAFRILLKDITPEATFETSALRLRFQYLLPLFVSPDRPLMRVQLAEADAAGGDGCVKITNAGNTHAKLVSIERIGSTAGAAAANQYVLAGRQSMVCTGEADLTGGAGIARAGFTSAYQNDVTLHDVAPSHR